MSQQINLFNPVFRKKGFSFTSSTAMLYGVCIAAAVGAAAAAYARYELRAADAAAQTVEKLQKETTARMEKLRMELAQQKPNAALQAEVTRLETQLKGRREIVDALNSGALGNTGGFSEYMRAFSRQSIGGLWLTGFDIAQGGNELAIRGRTLSADTVPTYLKQLNQEKPLQGRQFAALRIAQPPPEPAEQSKRDVAPKVDAAQQARKDANDTVPRYLEFVISTADIPEETKQSGKAEASPVPLSAVVDLNSADSKKSADRQGGGR